MNKSVFTGRLTNDVAFYPAKSEGGVSVARYGVALDHRKDEATAFVNCVVFGKSAEFARDNLKKGKKYLFTARIQPSTDKDGKVNGIQFVVEETEFIEPKEA